MTELVYFSDTFVFELEDASVVDVVPSTAKGCVEAVILDRTVMHPQGGGQPADHGTIRDAKGNVFNVKHVTKSMETGVVEHHGQFAEGSEKFSAGDHVSLEVDRHRRVLNARNHTAGHLIDYALDKYGMRITAGSGYHFPDGPYVDAQIEPPLDAKADLKAFGKQVEDALNEIVREGLEYKPVMAHPSTLPERTQGLLSDPMKELDAVRVLSLNGKAEDLMLPCGGTHAANTAQVGHITIRKVNRRPNGNIRFAYKIPANEEVEGLSY